MGIKLDGYFKEKLKIVLKIQKYYGLITTLDLILATKLLNCVFVLLSGNPLLHHIFHFYLESNLKTD